MGLLLPEAASSKLTEAPIEALADAEWLPPPPSAAVIVPAPLAVTATCREGLGELLRDRASKDADAGAEVVAAGLREDDVDAAAEVEAAALREADGDGVGEAAPDVGEARPLPDLLAELVTEGEGALDREARPERVAEGDDDEDAQTDGEPDAKADAEAVTGARLGLATDELVPPSACAEGVVAPEAVGALLKDEVAVAHAVLLMSAEAVPQALPEAVALSSALAEGSSGVPLGDREARGESEAEGVAADDREVEGESEARGVPVPPLPADSVAAAAVGVGAAVMEWARPLVVGAGETVGSAPEGLGGADPLLQPPLPDTEGVGVAHEDAEGDAQVLAWGERDAEGDEEAEGQGEGLAEPVPTAPPGAPDADALPEGLRLPEPEPPLLRVALPLVLGRPCVALTLREGSALPLDVPEVLADPLGRAPLPVGETETVREG